MVELAYALDAAGVINNGDATIKEIIEALALTFDADLGDYYRTYKDIENRSKDRTRFLDKLKTNLLNKMDDNK